MQNTSCRYQKTNLFFPFPENCLGLNDRTNSSICLVDCERRSLNRNCSPPQKCMYIPSKKLSSVSQKFKEIEIFFSKTLFAPHSLFGGIVRYCPLYLLRSGYEGSENSPSFLQVRKLETSPFSSPAYTPPFLCRKDLNLKRLLISSRVLNSLGFLCRYFNVTEVQWRTTFRAVSSFPWNPNYSDYSDTWFSAHFCCCFLRLTLKGCSMKSCPLCTEISLAQISLCGVVSLAWDVASMGKN